MTLHLTDPAVPRRHAVLSALRSPDFRMLWLGQSVSMIGDALILVATGIFVTRLTGRPSDVGLVLTAYALPLVAFVLVGGVVADRLPRQKVMIASDSVLAVLHGTLAVLIPTGQVLIWQMVVIGLPFGTAEALFRPAYSGLVPQTVPEDGSLCWKGVDVAAGRRRPTAFRAKEEPDDGSAHLCGPAVVALEVAD